MSPLRLALCITELDVGGAERCLVELATRIDRRRFTPVVYALSPRPATADRSLLPQLESAGVETHFLGARGARHFPRAVPRLAGLLKRQRPAVLQSFLFHANFVSRLSACLAGVPRVLSGVRVAERGAAWHVGLDRATRGLVDRYVCVSHDVAHFTRERLHLPEERVVVIPNGVDCERLARAVPADLSRLGLAEGRKAITYIGRLEAQKGVEQLVAHSPRWMARLSDHDLLLVGAGPLEKHLKELADRSGMAARIHLVGWRSDVPQIIQASDLVVLPSRWEGMPNAVLEAMAVGKAVVCTDVEGVRELLGDEAGAQVVPLGDDEAFSEHIATLAADEHERSRLAACNQVRANQFGLPAMVAAYERLFTELAGEGNAC